MTVSLTELRADGSRLFEEACATRVVLDHVMSKWGVLVLLALGSGTHRWSELRREVDGISEKMLASTLRTLTADGIVVRESFGEIPPRVEYSLTDLGVQLLEQLEPFVRWVSEHAAEIVKSGVTRDH